MDTLIEEIRDARRMPSKEETLYAILDIVRGEAERAISMHGPMRSHHEGYAVLAEEVDELWDEVKANRHDLAVAEAIQVAAMAVRYVLDLAR